MLFSDKHRRLRILITLLLLVIICTYSQWHDTKHIITIDVYDANPEYYENKPFVISWHKIIAVYPTKAGNLIVADKKGKFFQTVTLYGEAIEDLKVGDELNAWGVYHNGFVQVNRIYKIISGKAKIAIIISFFPMLFITIAFFYRYRFDCTHWLWIKIK